MKKTRARLDVVLVERGFFPTRAKASAALMAGQVLVKGRSTLKPGTPVLNGIEIEILRPSPYVSRGGLKLEGALDAFHINPAGRVCLDVGASTGGFTDCLLQRGAIKVYAVDVGAAQLDVKLRSDPRVVVREKTHARDIQPAQFDPWPDVAVIDVSFISLARVLPPVLPCLRPGFDIIALIKPQFELEPKKVPKGIVREARWREEAVAKIRALAYELGLKERGLIESPLRGAKGNIEYLLHLKC